MLTDDGVVKLIDFGLSRLRGETDAHPGQVKIGTPYYTAPEQEADADVADERSDLFSVGVMLYRMLTGELPAERRDDYRRPSVHDELLDADWDEFLHTARHPEPERRFQSAETMAKELHAVHADWSARIAQACRIEEPTPTVNQAPPPRVEPVKVGPDASLSVLPVDALWRPKRYIAGVEEAGPELARQPATGLVWQRGGSPYPLDWSAAAEYVRTLNRENYKGFSDWRLPTADELLAAMLPPTELSSYCLESVFAADRRLLWSADTRSFAAAWYADAALGFVWWADMGCRFHARAVRSERGERR
jgi:serine/threonine-protein kinase